MASSPFDALRVRAGAGARDLPAFSVSPGWQRLFEASGGSPLAVGAGLALGLAAAFLVLDGLEGRLAAVWAGEIPFWAHVEVRSAAVCALLLAGLVVTHHREEAGITRDLERLSPHLAWNGTHPRTQLRAAIEVPRDRLRLAGVAGALVVLAIVPTLYLEPARFLRPETYRLPSVAFDLLVGAVFGWTLTRTLVAAVVQDRAFARLADRVAEIDLLDLEPLRPFARRGLRRALRWLLLVTIAVFVFLDAGFAAPPALVLAGIVAFAAFSFILPVWGIHRRIQAEKRSLLADLRGRVRAERVRACAREAGAEPGGHLADLLAYEARVAAAREWPIDTSTLVRFAIYLLIPLGSWLGAAFVERALEAALG